MTDMSAGEILAASKTIAAAVKDGRVTPRSAVTWARRAAAGQDLGWLSHLTAAPGQRQANARPGVQAHSNEAVLQTLTAVLSGGPDPGAVVDPQYGHLFPDTAGHVEYDTSPPVYTTGLAPNGARRAVPYASAAFGGDLDGEADLDDASADRLFPRAGLSAAQSMYMDLVAAADDAA